MNLYLISKNLQLLRRKHNYTQDDLAQKLSISRQAISKWETGTAMPDVEMLLKLSRLYKLTINDILEPDIQPKIISDFEEITNLTPNGVKEILNCFDSEDIVKASMGASPKVNNFLQALYKDINFPNKQNSIGRVKIEEIESIQAQVVELINLKAVSEVNGQE